MPVQLTHTTNPLVYSRSGETEMVDAGDALITGSTDAVTSDFDQSYLLNRGSIVSAGTGVRFNEGFGTVFNAAEGYITGQTGVYDGADAAYTKINNDGHIEGSEAGIITDGEHTTIVNTGTIHGDGEGLYVRATANIVNSGLISGAGLGIDIQSGGVTISNTGQIDGAVYTVTIVSTTVNITNSGVINGDVTLGLGADIYDGRGGVLHGFVDGSGGGDRLYGGAGDDTLIGGGAGDRLDGGKGGGDVFVYRAVTDSTPKGMDLIARHWDASDLIDVNAVDANSHVKGNQDFAFGGLVGAGATLTTGQICYVRQGAETMSSPTPPATARRTSRSTSTVWSP